ncbi:hypothetical protein MLD38_001686 [Melastoma candidum]|uniref:Uncharacterized protein n=1 Tax=Melastoma candidum TaxID=119954 RepID=A0ACB9SDH1_9MYRT|nr:hypothetical protein MLD38_001686 [Melastoma candidum]
MSLSMSTTVAKVPASYLPEEIPWSAHHQVVRRGVSLHAGRSTTRVKNFYRGSRVVVRSSADPKPEGPSDRSDPWRTWVLGVTMSTVLSFFGSKWGPLMKIKNEVETTVDVAARVTEVVEDVAEAVEDVADAAEVKLPPGGKMREAAEEVAAAAKVTAKDAEVVEGVLDKVEELEEDVNELMGSDKDEDGKAA